MMQTISTSLQNQRNAERRPLLLPFDPATIRAEMEAVVQILDALWVDPERSLQAAAEALSIASIQEATPSRAIEIALLAILQRAEREGPGAIAHRVQEPFFRLPPRARFFLVALRTGRWSYRSLGRILGEEPDSIAQATWEARLQFSLSIGFPRASLPHPTGTGSGTSCPEYRTEAPWTQRFLDEEYPARERTFLQNHLMTCASCRGALDRARRFLYGLEKPLGEALLNTSSSLERRATELLAVLQEATHFRAPVRMPFAETFRRFINQPKYLPAIAVLSYCFFQVATRLAFGLHR